MSEGENSEIEVVPTGARLCAEVRGVDLSQPLSDGTFDKIHKAWLDNGVLLFRNQSLRDEDLISFSKRFGELDMAPASELHSKGGSEMESTKYPEIWIISNVKVNNKKIGSLGDGEAEWHTDLSYVENPPKASCLFSYKVPPAKDGGTTSWLNMYAALEEMPAELRSKIEGKLVNHTSSYMSSGDLRVGQQPPKDIATAPGTFHPTVITHPESGKEALYLGRRRNAYVKGMTVPESEELLNEVWSYTIQEKFMYRHEWRVGDMLIWDNRCTMHHREPFKGDRIMHRCQIKSPPVAA